MVEEDLDHEIERRAQAAVGTVLDRKWRLDRLLGCGGMGAVYAATHRNGTRGAIKILHPEAALSPTLRRRFLREGYVANKVEHPGAVSILDDDVDAAGNAYLVMELLQGETLDARLNRAGGRLDPKEVIQIACAVLECLEAAHERGIVHRDIKPGNLFITVDGGVKVLDFGIARLSETRGKRGDTTGVSTLGTPDFMPPEQARGHWDQVDGQSDVFAVGAVMLHALTGRPLREAPTTNEQLLMAMTEPLPALSTLLPDANELLTQLVDRALAFRKEDRWPDAATFRQAARAAYGSIADCPIERAPSLSVRPVPNSPVSAPSADVPERPFGLHDEAAISTPASALSARSMMPTRVVASRGSSTLLRGAVFAVAAAGAMIAMTFRGGAKGSHATPRGSAGAAVAAASIRAGVPIASAASQMDVPVAPTPASPSVAEVGSAPTDSISDAPPPPADALVKAKGPELGAHQTAHKPRRTTNTAEAPAEPAPPSTVAGGAPEETAAPRPVDLFSRRK